MSAHTPGPWFVQDSEQPFDGNEYVQNRAGSPFVTVHQTGDGTGRSVANARLIAAAPDLLAACVAVLTSPDCTLGAHERLQIRAAISKAEGKS